MQVPDEIRKCVVFICFRDDEGEKLGGTGFFISEDTTTPAGTKGTLTYVVTARHVLDGIRERTIDDAVLLRLNQTYPQPSVMMQTPMDRWEVHEDDTIDAAILPIGLAQDKFDYLPFPIAGAATIDVIKKEAIDIGDEVFLVGAFVNHVGRERNLPIVRIGNISLMPEEKVYTKKFGPMDAYLVEARSIGGLSGAPVFVHLGSTRTIGDSTMMRMGAGPFYWLGLMHGHWDVEANDVEQDGLGRDVFSREHVNMGIAIVVPATKVLELLQQPSLVERKNRTLKKIDANMSSSIGLEAQSEAPEPREAS